MHIERYGPSFRVSFLAADLKTPVGSPWATDSADRLLEMFERGAESRKLEDRQAFEYAIAHGRGACWLRLTDEQYAKLRKR